MTSRRARPLIVVIALVLGVVAWIAPSAGATAPGRNGRIVFVRYTPHSASLVTVRPDGTHRQVVIAPRFLDSPDWSPEGTHIAFCSAPPAGGNADIYIVGTNGGGRHRVTRYSGPDCDPAWSPDGEWIAFTRIVDNVTHVFAIRPDGSGLHRLVGHAREVAFSPDGEQIAFTREAQDHIAVFVRRVDGGNARRITPFDLIAVHPEWSPSGTRIAVLAPYYAFGTSQLYTLNPDGSDLIQITHLGPDRVGVRDVSWSPNGARLVLDLDSDIYTIRAGGGHRKLIVKDPAVHRNRYPDWASR